MSKLGVYIHIPFCLRKCNYCDFLSFPADRDAYSRYKAALIDEISQTEELGRGADTIFIGGGTPSVLPPVFISEILETLECSVKKMSMGKECVDSNAEITIEANPATVTLGSLTEYYRIGINRLSMGLQSANDAELAYLGRLHTRDDFRQNFLAAREAGFANISADVMFALPGQTLSSWGETLEFVAGLSPEHISAYGLTIEGGTVFTEMLERGEIHLDEELDRKMYSLAREALSAQGYEQYEISNFAKPGFCSRHNTKYWRRGEYIGLGLGAHSFVGGTRRRNTEDLGGYLTHGGNIGSIRRDVIVLTEADAMAEFMFLGLRMTRGVSGEDFRNALGRDLRGVYGKQLDRHIQGGTMMEEQGRVYLTERGVDVSNVVMADFLL